MPIYEYKCPDCNTVFEKLQSIKEKPIKECPECHNKNVSKIISKSSFVLKGDGWYKDHYGLKKS